MEAERLVVASRRKERLTLSSDEPILIRCEWPTLTMGLPSEAVAEFAADPDAPHTWGERDTVRDALLLDAANRQGLMKFVEDGEDNGLEDFDLDTRLEDRPDLREHEVVFAEATR